MTRWLRTSRIRLTSGPAVLDCLPLSHGQSVSSGIIQRFARHHLCQRLGGTVFGQPAAGEAAIQPGAQPDKRFQPVNSHTRASFERMRFPDFGNVGISPGRTVNAGDDAFQSL